MEKKILGILKFLNDIEALKSATRHSWTSAGRQESVAEHCWRMATMALVLQEEFSDIDIKKVTEMCLLHDLGEVYDGDTPAFEKFGSENQYLENEEQAVRKIVEPLSEKLRNKILDLCIEFNECKTAEAKLANALDKLEALIQHNEANLSTWTQEEHSLNLTYGRKDTDFNKITIKIREIIDQQTIKKTSKS